jgi:hypothetical protein
VAPPSLGLFLKKKSISRVPTILLYKVLPIYDFPIDPPPLALYAPSRLRKLLPSPSSPSTSVMAGGNLFGRALSYVVNEFLVEGLANK